MGGGHNGGEQLETLSLSHQLLQPLFIVGPQDHSRAEICAINQLGSELCRLGTLGCPIQAPA